MSTRLSRAAPAIPWVVLALAVALVVFWRVHYQGDGATIRAPGTDLPPGVDAAAALNPPSAGKLLKGDGSPSASTGSWSQFRGPGRSGISVETTPLARTWGAAGPRELWAVDCGEGYAGVAVSGGRVYLMDYDAGHKQGALRCLSAADGREIWRFAYPLSLKRNHGVTRTVPAVTDKYVVALDSKCNVICLDAATGELRWSINLVHEYGAVIPPWYAGQCPQIEGHSVILAPGGGDALLLSVDLETGKPLWRSPNPRGWKMTHSSVMPMEFAGHRFYVYCASGGVAGVSAADGALLWDTTDWKISIATIPSPLALDGGRIFLSGGYNAGSLMLQLTEDAGKLAPKVQFKLAPEVFGATQHTPVFYNGFLYGVRPNGQFVCLTLTGEVRWASPTGDEFGLGSFLLADGMFFNLNDSGKLTLAEATPERYHALADAQVLHGRESWGPMALADGHLFVRDFTRLACLDVGAH
jgi:outer membrane protein assembly factor BamB